MINADPLWYKNAVFYEVNVRAFCDSNGDGHGDLPGVIQKLDYLEELGVDCIWLQPIYPSPLKDDGYDIADYFGVLQTYGTLGDLKELVQSAHNRGMRIITDLVLNHTSDQHAWFQESRSNKQSAFRDYYVWSETDKKFEEARIIFLDTEPSNWSWDPQAGQYFWHRFYASQPDLNYDNLDVQQAMLGVARFWLELGVDGFRADAVPYLFEREGTNCENLPETHAYLKMLRRFIDENFPGRILLCEANQWPADVRPYFGEGDEFQLGFHFPIMPRIYMALRKEDRSPLEWILKQTPEIPSNCQWCTFLRNHDELTLEMVTEEERQWMWREYAPIPRMRLNLGIRRRLAPLLENDRRKIELANSLLFTMTGSPVLYYGDEIGMGDNIDLPDRNGVRTPMQWDNTLSAGFSSAHPDDLYAPLISDGSFGYQKVNVLAQIDDPGSLWHTIRKMIWLRKSHSVLGWGDFNWADGCEEGIAAYWRSDSHERLLCVHNLTHLTSPIAIPIAFAGDHTCLNLFSGERFQLSQAGCYKFTLQPFEYLWLQMKG